MLNYLNKGKKYDITKSSKAINLFGVSFSFDIYRCDEYTEVCTKRSIELIDIANNDGTRYLNDVILKSAKDASVVDRSYEVNEKESGIEVITKYVINEEVSEFVEGDVQVRKK